MTAQWPQLRAGPKQIRTLQRTVHLLTGALLVAYVYFPLDPVGTGIRWVVLPALTLSGLLMWQWPRLRRIARRRDARR